MQINPQVILCTMLLFILDNDGTGEARCAEQRMCPAQKECLETPSGVYCCCQENHCNTKLLPQNTATNLSIGIGACICLILSLTIDY